MLLMKILILYQQLHILQLHKLPFTTAHFNFTTAQFVINCTLKYALPHMDDVHGQIWFDASLYGKMCLRQNDPVGLTVRKHWRRENKAFYPHIASIFCKYTSFYCYM